MKKEKRFEFVHEESNGFGKVTSVLRDKQNGVCYLFVSSGYGGGLTPLLDADGRPVISKSTGNE